MESLGTRIKNALTGRSKTNNSMGQNLDPNEFLRRGNRRQMIDTWSDAQMSDVDFYSGYSYAAINSRANKVSQLALESVKTDAIQKIIDASREKNQDIVHPYLKIIDESDDFTNAQFWYDISTYLDLEGVYYLMAVRNISPRMVGNVQYFKMLNPYQIRRVKNEQTMEIGGYIETRDGMMREIPKEMIIEIRKLNPFNRDQTFSMTDAAKEYQFTMKQASDFTRSSLKNNLSAPGIISTDVLMDPERFANFQSRVVNQEKGMPLFGNGAGAISWDPMQIDMDKAALLDINSINRDTLFAVSGVSKTTMGIEESGTTRDTSKVQKDKFIEDHIMPQLQLILDALNQDYKKYYKKEYAANNYKLIIDNPLSSDKEGEKLDVEIAKESFELYTDLLKAGYETEVAAKYAAGEISLEELGEPEEVEDEETTEDNPEDTKDTKPNTDDPDGGEGDESDDEPDEETKLKEKKNKQRYLKRYGIEKFVERYDGKLTKEELSEYLEVV